MRARIVGIAPLGTALKYFSFKDAFWERESRDYGCGSLVQWALSARNSREFSAASLNDRNWRDQLTFTFITATSWRLLHQSIAVIDSRAAVLFALNKSILKRVGSRNFDFIRSDSCQPSNRPCEPVSLTLTLRRQTAEGMGWLWFSDFNVRRNHSNISPCEINSPRAADEGNPPRCINSMSVNQHTTFMQKSRKKMFFSLRTSRENAREQNRNANANEVMEQLKASRRHLSNKSIKQETSHYWCKTILDWMCTATALAEAGPRGEYS